MRKPLRKDKILIFSLLNLISEGGHINVMDLIIPLIIEVMLNPQSYPNLTGLD